MFTLRSLLVDCFSSSENYCWWWMMICVQKNLSIIFILNMFLFPSLAIPFHLTSEFAHSERENCKLKLHWNFFKTHLIFDILDYVTKTHKSFVGHVLVMKFEIITSIEAHQIRSVLHYESSFYVSLHLSFYKSIYLKTWLWNISFYLVLIMFWDTLKSSKLPLQIQ